MLYRETQPAVSLRRSRKGNYGQRWTALFEVFVGRIHQLCCTGLSTFVQDHSSQTKVLGLPTSHLALAAIGIGLLDMIVRDPSLLGIAILGMVTAVSYTQFKKIRRWKLWTQGLVVGTATLLATVWLNYFTPPAQALFFSAAEDFFNEQFNLSTAAIGIVFATLRALYILYIAVSLINVVNTVRQDDDWQVAARLPVLVVVVVTVADVLTELIVT